MCYEVHACIEQLQAASASLGKDSLTAVPAKTPRIISTVKRTVETRLEHCRVIVVIHIHDYLKVYPDVLRHCRCLALMVS